MKCKNCKRLMERTGQWEWDCECGASFDTDSEPNWTIPPDPQLEFSFMPQTPKNPQKPFKNVKMRVNVGIISNGDTSTLMRHLDAIGYKHHGINGLRDFEPLLHGEGDYEEDFYE